MTFTEAFTTSAAEARLITKGGEAACNGSVLTLSLPAGGIGFFEFGDVPKAGVYKNGLYLHHLENGVTWKGQTAVLYKEYDGVREMLRFVENGEMLQFDTGKYILKAFDWDSFMQPQSKAVCFTSQYE